MSAPQTSQLGAGLIGSLILGKGADTSVTPPPPVLRTHTALIGYGIVGDIWLGTDGVTGGGVTPPPVDVEGEWEVHTEPVVRWAITETPELAVWKVHCGPHVEWGITVTNAPFGWKVKCHPKVKWTVGPGVADTACIAAAGGMPDPEGPPEPPAPGDQNYVF